MNHCLPIHFIFTGGARPCSGKSWGGRKQKQRHFLAAPALFILAAGAFAYGAYTPLAPASTWRLLLAAVFVLLVIKHIRLKEIEFLQKLVQVNEKACLRLEGKWTGFAGQGEALRR